MIDKLDKLAIRIYNWILKFLIVSYIIMIVFISVLCGFKIDVIKELIRESNKFVESLAYESGEDDKK